MEDLILSNQMAIPDYINEPSIPETQPNSNKRRRRKSIVWEHFTVETISAECLRACCNQCKKSFAYMTGSKPAGTSHLKRHITLGICPVSRRNQEKNEFAPYDTTSKMEACGNGSVPAKRRKQTANLFDQELCNHALAKMIIRHDYPLQIVQHAGFIDFVRTIQPRFSVASFNTMQAECVSIYLREKQILLDLIYGISGRISLTLDLWTSDQGLGYAVLTGHFIDDDWKLHRRILTVSMIPSHDSDVAFNHAVVTCLTDWNMGSKLFSLTVDSSFSNETVVSNLRGLLCIRNSLLFNGQLAIGNCYARVLSRLALDVLESMSITVSKVRESVKYVKTSEAREEKFFELKHHLQVPSTRSLVTDDLLKWDTTYHMLVAANELREVFSCLKASDSDYKASPMMDEWQQVEALCTYLKLLYDAASILTATPYPTSNTFFHEVWKLKSELTHGAMHEDPFISNLIKPLQEKFDIYWRESCLVLAAAVVMDPRFKMKLVEFSFPKIFGEDAETWIQIVDGSLHELFLDYVMPVLPLSPTFVEGGSEVATKREIPDGELPITTGDGLSDFDVYISESSNSQEMKSELDQYLEESLLPRVPDFDILGWWKLNKLKYPTLSKMAGDILSIPVSTVASDCVFDTGRKKVDCYQSSLRSITLEALICAKNWLQNKSPEIANAIVKMEY